MGNDKLTLTVEETAAVLGISRGLAYEMVKTGRIPSVRFGKRVLVPRQALERLLDSRDKSDTKGVDSGY